MDYLKYNCHDLAAQNSELSSLHNRMLSINDELVGTLSTLDMQIKSYEDMHKSLSVTQREVAGISARILTAHNALDQIIDLYYAAEQKAMQTVEDLPVGISIKSGNKNPTAVPAASKSSINNSDLILEDWLAELIYRKGKG